MAEAHVEEVLNISKEKLFPVIARYEDYPQFVSGVIETAVERNSDGTAKVHYTMNMLKEITYTIESKEDPANFKLEWKLIESGFMKKNSGSWTLSDAGPGRTTVKYWIDVEFAFPVPGFIVKKLIKGSIPEMLKEFEKRAKANA